MICLLFFTWSLKCSLKIKDLWYLWFFCSIQKALANMSGKNRLMTKKKKKKKMDVCNGLWYQKGNIFGGSFWEGKKIERAV